MGTLKSGRIGYWFLPRVTPSASCLHHSGNGPSQKLKPQQPLSPMGRHGSVLLPRLPVGTPRIYWPWWTAFIAEERQLLLMPLNRVGDQHL